MMIKNWNANIGAIRIEECLFSPTDSESLYSLEKVLDFVVQGRAELYIRQLKEAINEISKIGERVR
jgi:hypothetical protein